MLIFSGFKYFSFILFLLTSELIRAQTTTTLPIKQFSLSFEGGISFPVNGMEDYANTGYRLSLNSNYFFTKCFGVMFGISSLLNEGEQMTYSDIHPGLNHPGLGGGTVNLAFSYHTGQWKTNSLLTGPVFRTGKNNFCFSFYMQTGIEIVNSPEIIINEDCYDWIYWTLQTPPTYYSTTQTTSKMTDYTIPLLIGYDFSYHLKNRMFLLTDINYLISKSKLEGDIVFIIEYEDPNYKDKEYKTPVSFINTVNALSWNLGVGYVF